jgi:hypothetical protein
MDGLTDVEIFGSVLFMMQFLHMEKEVKEREFRAFFKWKRVNPI